MAARLQECPGSCSPPITLRTQARRRRAAAGWNPVSPHRTPPGGDGAPALHKTHARAHPTPPGGGGARPSTRPHARGHLLDTRAHSPPRRDPARGGRYRTPRGPRDETFERRHSAARAAPQPLDLHPHVNRLPLGARGRHDRHRHPPFHADSRARTAGLTPSLSVRGTGMPSVTPFPGQPPVSGPTMTLPRFAARVRAAILRHTVEEDPIQRFRLPPSMRGTLPTGLHCQLPDGQIGHSRIRMPLFRPRARRRLKD